MTTSTARHAWVDVIDLEDTVTFHVPGEQATVRLLTTPRDTDDAPITKRISFGVLSESGELPLCGIDPGATAALDALQLRFERFACADLQPGRHRAPGLLARLLGSKGGAA